MFKRRGIFAVFAVLFIFAFLHIGGAKEAHDSRIVGSTLLGGFAFLLMTASIWLSTRPRFAESFFGGLDRMYQIHKFCGIFAGLLVLAHFASVPDKLSHFDAAQRGDFFPSVPLGITAFVLLILSLALALNRKISYSKWRNPHKAMGLVYILAIGHFVTAPIVFFDKFGPSGYMLMAAAIIGVISLFYSLFGMNRKTALTYKIDAVNRLERATELVLSPLDKPITFKPGQFAFVEVQGKGWLEPHPFTISSAPNDKELRFTMKV